LSFEEISSVTLAETIASSYVGEMSMHSNSVALSINASEVYFLNNTVFVSFLVDEMHKAKGYLSL